MLLSSVAIFISLIVLVWSADRFVMGASSLAQNLGVSPLVIGMLIMGFGTSAPEMFVAATAALNDNPSVAIGNALGSNIANIALVLGITSVIRPLLVESQILRREFPALFITMGFVLFLFWDSNLSQMDGFLLLLATAMMMIWTFRLAQKSRNHADPYEANIEASILVHHSTAYAISWTIAGLFLLLLSSHFLVWGSVNIAHQLGVSDLVIGLTIIAIGTSLPELAVSISGAIKGEDEIAIGNIIGSNMFNLLAVVGLATAIQPSELQPEVLQRDYAIMVGLSIAMFFMAFVYRSGGRTGRINRFEGSLLLSGYIAYMYWLYLSEVQ